MSQSGQQATRMSLSVPGSRAGLPRCHKISLLVTSRHRASVAPNGSIAISPLHAATLPGHWKVRLRMNAPTARSKRPQQSRMKVEGSGTGVDGPLAGGLG